jgi:EAL domain-containing protein (putative c-di-GMP-specific phosphodiesterase class I)
MSHCFQQQQTTPEVPARNTVWFLKGQLGPAGEATYIPIAESPLLVGRRPDLGLCLPFRTVSSLHAEIRTDNGKVVVEDKNSTNGTYVNGRRIDRATELESDDLIQFADIPLRLCRQNPEIRTQTVAEDVYDQALALVQFDRLMSERKVTPNYQPIVDMVTGETVGYEVLGRSRLFGLETPAAMFQAAAKMNLEVQLSTMLRWEGIRQSATFATRPHLFLNTHPAELSEKSLTESLRAVRQVNSRQPLTLEIHEAAVTDVKQMSELRAALNDLDISLAFDDFGAGHSRLAELVKVRPEYLKFDISLIHDIHSANAQHQQMIAALAKMVRDLGIVAFAEGVETAEESETCRQLGFQLAQGFLYGKPAPATCY